MRAGTTTASDSTWQFVLGLPAPDGQRQLPPENVQRAALDAGLQSLRSLHAITLRALITSAQAQRVPDRMRQIHSSGRDMHSEERKAQLQAADQKLPQGISQGPDGPVGRLGSTCHA